MNKKELLEIIFVIIAIIVVLFCAIFALSVTSKISTVLALSCFSDVFYL